MGIAGSAADLAEIVVAADLAGPMLVPLSIAESVAVRASVPVRVVLVASPGQDQGANRVELAATAAAVELVAVTTEVVESNDVAPALLAAAGDGLLCVRTRAHGPLAALLLGETVTDLLLGTTRPILLVGPEALPGQDLGILEVCADSPPVAEALLATVGPWARRLDQRVRLVTVTDVDEGPVGLARRGASADALAAVARNAADRLGIEVDVEVLQGTAVVDEIAADAARSGAGLIAVAVRPRTRLRRKALGSYAVGIAHRATAAVLAVPVPAVD